MGQRLCRHEGGFFATHRSRRFCQLARNASFVRYAPSNPLPVARLGEAFRNDPIIRPTFEGLEGCYFYNAFDAATQAALDAIKP